MQLGLLVMAGVVGFLIVRRWGLGLAVGGSLPIVWMTASTMFELTDRPVGPGFRNPGATDMHIHGVTIIGVSADRRDGNPRRDRGLRPRREKRP